MNFQTSIKTCLNKYADFSGRASRSEFWFFMLFFLLISIASNIIGNLIGLGSTLDTIASLGLLIPSIAVTARRLHDIDKSGWWQLIFIIPIVGLVLAIIWLTKKGEEAPNRFDGVAV